VAVPLVTNGAGAAELHANAAGEEAALQ